MISKLNTQKPNTKLKLCMSEKLSMSDKKRSWINQKGQEEESYPKTINFPHAPFVPISLFPIMHPGGEVNFRKRGSKFSLPLSYRHQTLHLVHILSLTSPSPFPSSTRTRMRQTPDTPLSGSQVYIKGYICYHPANDSRSGGKFPKRLWRCVVGGYNKMIWFC